MTPLGTPYIQPSQRSDWQIPRDLFDSWWDEFGGFDMDPFCLPNQYTARRVLENGGDICVPLSAHYTSPTFLNAIPYADPKHVFSDGLTTPWHGRVYMHSPYGLFLRRAVAKAVFEVQQGNCELVVALVPSKTDTRWFQQYVLRRAHADHNTWGELATPVEVAFLKGRLRFDDGDDPAGFASARVVWR